MPILVNPYIIGSAPAGDFDPTSPAATLEAWYDYSDETTVTKNGSNEISQLDDKSGNGYHVTQTQGSNKPEWVDSAHNGLACGRYAGAQFMEGSDTVTGREVYVVSKRDTANASGVLVGYQQDGVYFGYVSSFIYCYSSKWNRTNYSGNSLGLFHSNFNDADEYIAIDNVDQTLSNNGTILVPVNSIYHGKRHNAGSEFYLDGDICEVAIYSGTLSTSDRNSLADYFMNKWGLS